MTHLYTIKNAENRKCNFEEILNFWSLSEKDWSKKWLDRNKAPGVKIYNLFIKQIGLSGTKLAKDHQRRLTRELYETLWIVFEGKRIKNLKGVPVIILNFLQFWPKVGYRLIRLRRFQKSRNRNSLTSGLRILELRIRTKKFMTLFMLKYSI